VDKQRTFGDLDIAILDQPIALCRHLAFWAGYRIRDQLELLPHGDSG
jgi:hypothetical protein